MLLLVVVLWYYWLSSLAGLSLHTVPLPSFLKLTLPVLALLCTSSGWCLSGRQGRMVDCKLMCGRVEGAGPVG